jgi:hypothetical protein
MGTVVLPVGCTGLDVSLEGPPEDGDWPAWEVLLTGHGLLLHHTAALATPTSNQTNTKSCSAWAARQWLCGENGVSSCRQLAKTPCGTLEQNMRIQPEMHAWHVWGQPDCVRIHLWAATVWQSQM